MLSSTLRHVWALDVNPIYDHTIEAMYKLNIYLTYTTCTALSTLHVVVKQV